MATCVFQPPQCALESSCIRTASAIKCGGPFPEVPCLRHFHRQSLRQECETTATVQAVSERFRIPGDGPQSGRIPCERSVTRRHESTESPYSFHPCNRFVPYLRIRRPGYVRAKRYRFV